MHFYNFASNRLQFCQVTFSNMIVVSSLRIIRNKYYLNLQLYLLKEKKYIERINFIKKSDTC